jgi:hypothetical protein
MRDIYVGTGGDAEIAAGGDPAEIYRVTATPPKFASMAAPQAEHPML